MSLLTLILVMTTAAVPAAPDAASIEREARQIETMLIAPCCWNQQVSQHQSPASDEVKKQIRVLLTAGRTRQQVLDSFVEQYGRRILAEPRAEGFGRLLYVGLPLTFLLSAAGLVVFLRRARVRALQPAAGAAPPTAPDEAGYAERLDDELREMD